MDGQNVNLASQVLEKSSLIIVDWEEKLRKLNLNFPEDHIIWIARAPIQKIPILIDPDFN